MKASDFIRKYPTMKAKELVELGAKHEFKFSPGLVYMVRSAGKKKAKKNGAARRAPKHRKVNRKARKLATVANGKTPVSLSAIVDQFKKDLEGCFQQQVTDLLTEALRPS